MEVKCPCQFCGQNIAFPVQAVGLQTNCPHCGQSTLLVAPVSAVATPSVSSAAAPSRRASIVKKTDAVGGGCALQGVAVVLIILGFVSIMTIIGPIFFWGLGAWLLHYGNTKASWLECSACSGKVTDARATVCPHCHAQIV